MKIQKKKDITIKKKEVTWLGIFCYKVSGCHLCLLLSSPFFHISGTTSWCSLQCCGLWWFLGIALVWIVECGGWDSSERVKETSFYRFDFFGPYLPGKPDQSTSARQLKTSRKRDEGRFWPAEVPLVPVIRCCRLRSYPWWRNTLSEWGITKLAANNGCYSGSTIVRDSQGVVAVQDHIPSLSISLCSHS